MRAAVFEGEGRLVVRDVDDPLPGPDEVLLEVEACGICEVWVMEGVEHMAAAARQGGSS